MRKLILALVLVVVLASPSFAATFVSTVDDLSVQWTIASGGDGRTIQFVKGSFRTSDKAVIDYLMGLDEYNRVYFIA